MSKETVSVERIRELRELALRRSTECVGDGVIEHAKNTVAICDELLRLRASPSPGWQPIELPVVEQHDDEIWLPVAGWESSYTVSNYGAVKNKSDEIMGQWLNQDGYPLVRLTNLANKQRKLYRVHRLVAEAFVANPEGAPNVNHLNCDRTDNRAANLQWCTQKENVAHANKYGRMHRHGRKADQWMSIETAPKDGTHVLLYWPDALDSPISGYFDGVRWSVAHCTYNFMSQPDSWQPLPSAPAAGGV